jgi:PhnB protein
MRLNPHLTFNGHCEAAFKFYEKHLGGKITLMMTYGESPLAAAMPPDSLASIIHATLALGDYVLTGADESADRYQKPHGFSVLLNVDSVAEAERVFQALSEEGEVRMPIQETFWARRFGMVVDQFGIPWLVNTSKEA